MAVDMSESDTETLLIKVVGIHLNFDELLEMLLSLR